MSSINWAYINDGGAFESLMHSILYAESPGTVLFGRPGKDAGQDARSADGVTVYQAKYRKGLTMDGAISLALDELDRIKTYRDQSHSNHQHWEKAENWVLVANFSINPNDDAKWQSKVTPAFRAAGLEPSYWDIESLNGKLVDHPEIQDVFFGGENRVLVGLKEAHDLLVAECVGSKSLEVPMLGRDDALTSINQFLSSGEKRVLPVLGRGGIGKSRLLYEGLVALSQDGWRVLWGLPGSMARSSQWFRLLNGNQKTCVVLDNPDDTGLLRALMEQLAVTERQNWRVLIALRNENAGVLRPLSSNSYIDSPIELKPISETLTHQLANSCLDESPSKEWLHAVYNLTHGVPGWVCLVATLANEGKLSALPSNADGIASIYIDSCLDALDTELRKQGLILIRWLSIWGSLSLESNDPDNEQVQLTHLENEGIPKSNTKELLEQLTNAGLVRNWGVNKRLYAVDPLVLRQRILDEWLFRKSEGAHEISDAGSDLVRGLVAQSIPAVESILGTLSHFAYSRLDENETELLLEPIFSAMAITVRQGDIVEQYGVLDLVKKAGSADPESAFFILKDIRENEKESKEVQIAEWYREDYSHKKLLGKVPWILFNLGEHVSDLNMARNLINEFRHYIELEEGENLIDVESGKEPGVLLKRLLTGGENSQIYCSPAYNLFAAEVSNPESWATIKIIAESLLDPIREFTSWTSSFTMTFHRRALLPGSNGWSVAMGVRKSLFSLLRESTDASYRIKLWQVLSSTHHAFHRAVLHGYIQGESIQAYQAITQNDLLETKEILKTPSADLAIEEATISRDMWEWYLEHGREDDPVVIAKECEDIFSKFPFNKWRLYDFFSFKTDEELEPETQRVVKQFREATSSEVFSDFFDQSSRYLKAVRGGGQDMADLWRMTELAEGCSDLFRLDEDSSENALTAYVKEILQTETVANAFAWDFSTKVCRSFLLACKSGKSASVEVELDKMLSQTANRSQFIWDIYANVHPQSIGDLTLQELSCLRKHEKDFPQIDWFYVLGAFYTLDPGGIRHNLETCVNALKDNPDEASKCVARFVKSVYMSALRYNWKGHQLPVSWILKLITDFNLDSALLDMHDLKSLRDQAGFRLDMIQTKALISSRITLEQSPRPSEDFRATPHDFSTNNWCSFDDSVPEEVDAFNQFCAFVLGPTFTERYWIPKYVAHLDSSGEHIVAFIMQYLSENPEADASTLSRLGSLASAYDESSPIWAEIAAPICARAEAALRRKDRVTVYFGLSKKETGVLTSAPGEVPDHYIKAEEQAQRLLDNEPSNSPLRGYRDWALRCAKYDLRHAKERAEEDTYP